MRDTRHFIAAKLPPATAPLAGASLQVGGTVGAVICFVIYRANAARLAARPELRDA